MSAPFGLPVTSPAADRLVDDGERLELAGFQFQVREIPGHSPGSVVFISEQFDPPIVFGGDVLFAGSVGRTDLGGDFPLLRSGHPLEALHAARRDPGLPRPRAGTTIGAERRTNPFVGDHAGSFRSRHERLGDLRPAPLVRQARAARAVRRAMARPRRQDRAGLARGRPAGRPRPPARRPLDGPESSRGPARPRLARGAARHQGPLAGQPRPLVERRGAGPPDLLRRRCSPWTATPRRSTASSSAGRGARRLRPTSREADRLAVERELAALDEAPGPGGATRAAIAIGRSTSSGITRPSTPTAGPAPGSSGSNAPASRPASTGTCTSRLNGRWPSRARSGASATTASPPTPSASGPSGSTAYPDHRLRTRAVPRRPRRHRPERRSAVRRIALGRQVAYFPVASPGSARPDHRISVSEWTVLPAQSELQHSMRGRIMFAGDVERCHLSRSVGRAVLPSLPFFTSVTGKEHSR